MADLIDVRTQITNSIISQNFGNSGKTIPNNLVGRVDIANTKYNLVGVSGSTILNLLLAVRRPFTQRISTLRISRLTTTEVGPAHVQRRAVLLDGTAMVTQALLSNSPAVNAGNPFNRIIGSEHGTKFDQRGNLGGGVVRNEPNRHRAFQRQANPLVGDYNFNGVVDAADYTVWRIHSGRRRICGPTARNGTIDKTTMPSGNRTSARGHCRLQWQRATDIADYNLWPSTYGSTTDLAADCNEDGIVDEADYTSGSTPSAAR